MSQEDKSRKKVAVPTSDGWGRKNRMNKMHRKGRKQDKSQRSRDRRLLDQAIIKTEQK
jgi:hypothetical protein